LKIIANNAEKIQTPHIDEFDKTSENIDISRKFDYIKIPITEIFGDDEIKQSLENLNKFSERDELNCGGCGYDDCRTFATALLNGTAERQMCVAYMRGVANDKASVLLQKIPSGVVMVDNDLRIVDCNAKFASLCGEEVELIYEANPGLHGADLRKTIHSHKFFSTVLETGNDIIEQDVRDGDLYYNLSVITIQKYNLVLGIVQNMREPQVQKELVLNRTREVIQENMKIVQQIAYLLGENASYTETMLNSIVESHDHDAPKS
jgi:transcriptional regulator with PAS, ATPase and Fis domain